MLLSCYNANTTPAVVHAGGVDERMEIVLFFFSYKKRNFLRRCNFRPGVQPLR